ncbi:hypothetical protein GCM10027456_39630 [Kineosporia babensis]
MSQDNTSRGTAGNENRGASPQPMVRPSSSDVTHGAQPVAAVSKPATPPTGGSGVTPRKASNS